MATRLSLQMTDRQLMEAVDAGDAVATEQLVSAYRVRILRFLIGRGESREDALDLTQEVLSRICAKASSFNGVSLSAWVFKVARNLQIDGKRKRNFRLHQTAGDLEVVMDRVPASRNTDPQLRAEQLEIRRRVADAIRGLPPRQREVVELRLLSELRLEEIAEAVGLSLGGVKSTLHNALANLRESLADLNGTNYVHL